MPRLPGFLLGVYLGLFTICAIRPYSRQVWFAENTPIVLIVAGLIATYRYHRFSNAAYVWMSVLAFLHTIGGHYTFERVPFDFVTNLFGFSRNHYDRLCHFAVGFYAFAIAELIDTRRWINSRLVLYSFPIFTIFTVAAVYEIVEWMYAAASNPTAGAAFLGSQGDIWDAQKDMLADGLGSLVATAAYAFRRRKG
jgi:putative membrane protein